MAIFEFWTLTVKYRFFVESWFVLVKVILDLFLIKILCLMQDQIESDFKKWSTCRYNVGILNNFKNFVKCHIWHFIWFSSFIWSFSRVARINVKNSTFQLSINDIDCLYNYQVSIFWTYVGVSSEHHLENLLEFYYY